MVSTFKRWRRAVSIPLCLRCFVLVLAAAWPGRAHTIPLSYLTLVADRDYLHLELALNPFELSFFGEMDSNRNHRLDPAELGRCEELLVRKLSAGLDVVVDGEGYSPETAGITADLDSHHLAYRAHYRIDAREARLVLRSNLASMTSGAHVTEVTYLRPEGRLAARLDAQSRQAVFPGFTRTGAERAIPSGRGGASLASWLNVALVGAASAVVLAVGLAHGGPKRSRAHRKV